MTNVPAATYGATSSAVVYANRGAVQFLLLPLLVCLFLSIMSVSLMLILLLLLLFPLLLSLLMEMMMLSH